MTVLDKEYSPLEVMTALVLTQFEFNHLFQSLNLDHFGQKIGDQLSFSDLMVMEICKLLCGAIPEFNPFPFFRYDEIDHTEFLNKKYCLLWMDRNRNEQTGIFRVLTPRCSDTIAENINLPGMYSQENLSNLEQQLQRENIVIEEFTDSHIEEVSHTIFTKIVFLDLSQIRGNLEKKT